MKTWLAILAAVIGSFACSRQTAPPTAAPVLTTLSNDDIDWIYPYDTDGYQCGPCKEVSLTVPPAGPALLHVRWTSSDPIHLWLEGSNADELTPSWYTSGCRLDRAAPVVFRV